MRNGSCMFALLKHYSGVWIKKNEMGEACRSFEEMSGAYRVLVGKTEGRRLLTRPRCMCENNIKMDL